MRLRRLAPLLLLLAACTAPDEGVSTGYSSPEEFTAEAPTEAPTLVQFEMGETFTTERGSTITVHEARLDLDWEYPPDGGGVWHAADVEYCLGDTLPDPGAFEAFSWDWVMRTTEGYVLDHPGSWRDEMLTPRLDLTDVTPIPGECYRGWVLFDGPEDVTVTSVRFYEVDWAIE